MRPTEEQARKAISDQAAATGWSDESAVTDAAMLKLVADGFDPAAARKAVDRAFDRHFKTWGAI